MTVRKTVGTVGTLAHGAVSTAASVARHPIGSAALAAGLVKGAAEAGIGLIRGGRPDSPAAATETAASPTTATEEPRNVEHQAPSEDPRDHLPGPDLHRFEPPRPDDLPEPIVIEAEPVVDEEAFQTEPKAASRASAHGGPAGDREEREGYVEEIPEDYDEAEKLPRAADQHVE